MDALVQLVRNAMCCIKDLNLYSDSVLYDPLEMGKYYSFPSPHLNKTTPLEFLISLSQLYACLSCIYQGYHSIKSLGVNKLRRITRVFPMRMKMCQEEASKAKKAKVKTSEGDALHHQIVLQSLLKESDNALRSVLVGICLMLIGISFFWLFGNSLHITDAGWIGGVPALIHALSVMEIALVPLLFYMIKDGMDSIQSSERIIQFSNNVVSYVSKDKKNWINRETYSFIQQNGSWTPFWVSDDPVASEQLSLENEIKCIITVITAMSSGKESSADFKKTLKHSPEDVALNMTAKAEFVKFEGCLEFVYFFLNFFAFYGYLLAIITYYFDKEDDQPIYVSSLRLGYSNNDAEWTGNFAGDLMWTIEPFVIFTSPLLFSFLSKKNKKIKTD